MKSEDIAKAIKLSPEDEDLRSAHKWKLMFGHVTTCGSKTVRLDKLVLARKLNCPIKNIYSVRHVPQGDPFDCRRQSLERSSRGADSTRYKAEEAAHAPVRMTWVKSENAFRVWARGELLGMFPTRTEGEEAARRHNAADKDTVRPQPAHAPAECTELRLAASDALGALDGALQVASLPKWADAAERLRKALEGV